MDDVFDSFFATADQLHRDLIAAADVIETNRDPESATIDRALFPTVEWPFGLTAALPPGLTPDTEHGLLMVVANLQSRWIGLQRSAIGDDDPPQWVVEEAVWCFDSARSAAAAYDATVAVARQRTESEPDLPVFDPSSPEAGMLAARLAYIGLTLGGCESCGTDAAGLAALAAAPIDVVWGEIENPPWGDDLEYDGVAGGIPFHAEFIDGRWDVVLMAC